MPTAVAYLRMLGLVILLTGILAIAGTLLLTWAGFSFRFGLAISAAAAVAVCLVALCKADQYTLRIHNAQRLVENSYPELQVRIAELARAAGLPPPRVYVMPTAQPNAYAVGRTPERAAIVLSEGLLRRLNEGSPVSRELSAVVAHELAHIKSRDTLTMPLVATVAGTIFFVGEVTASLGDAFSRNVLAGLSRVIQGSLGWLSAKLVQMAISRSREYQADLLGAEICGDPLALASALEKIDGQAATVPNQSAEAHPASAELFIINPFPQGSARALFSSHPKTADRVARLRALSPN
jgi:heat shock protein HtpX